MSEYRTEVLGGSAGDAPGVLPVSGRIGGRYVILDCIAEGGMGKVYTAFDPKLDRQVALKLPHSLDAGLVEQSLQEAQALAALAHPNVLTIHDAGMHAGRMFLVTELFPGVSLRDWAAATKPDWRRVARVLRAAGQGLAAAHRSGFVHRDVKPDNILVQAAEGGDAVKVIDFGLALRAETRQDSGLPSATLGWGTPGYAAPEQMRGLHPDARCDQFAFCAVLYEALAGEPLFPHLGDTPPAQRPAVMRERIDAAPWARLAVPARIKALLRRGLAWEPEQRFSSMEPILSELRIALAPRRRPWLAATVLLAGAGILGSWWLAAPAGSPCDGIESAALSFGEDAMVRLRSAFEATGAPYAGQAADIALELFSRHDAQIRQARAEVCRATHERGEQSAHLLDVRNLCLDRRAREAAALFSRFENADSDLVARAAEAASALSPVAECANREALLALSERPETAAEAARREPLREGLDQLRADYLVGDAETLRSGLATMGEAIEAEAYPPLLAEFHYLAARANHALGDLAGAQEAYRTAYRNAVAARDDATAAQSASTLGTLLAVELKQTLDARFWTALAHDERTRSDADDPRTELTLRVDHARIAQDAGEYEDSKVWSREALEIAAAHPELISRWDALRSRVLLANADILLGDYEAALDAYLPLVDDYAALLGEEHPRMSILLSNLNMLYGGLGRPEEAVAAAERAVEIAESALGLSHYNTFVALNNYSTALDTMGRSDEALAAYQRALVSGEQALGADNPNLANVMGNTAQLLGKLGRWAEAEAMADRALALPQDGLPPDLRCMLLLAKALPHKHLGGDPGPLLQQAEALLPLLENAGQREMIERDMARIRDR